MLDFGSRSSIEEIMNNQNFHSFSLIILLDHLIGERKRIFFVLFLFNAFIDPLNKPRTTSSPAHDPT